MNWNPYYVAYARVLGRTPEAQAALDDGRNAAFMAWITAQHREHRRLGLRDSDAAPAGAEAEAFTAWLMALPTAATT